VHLPIFLIIVLLLDKAESQLFAQSYLLAALVSVKISRTSWMPPLELFILIKVIWDKRAPAQLFVSLHLFVDFPHVGLQLCLVVQPVNQLRRVLLAHGGLTLEARSVVAEGGLREVPLDAERTSCIIVICVIHTV